MAAIYYDDECRFCRDMLRRFGRTLARRRFTFVPLQSPGAARVLGVSEEHLLDEMRVRFDDGAVFGGAAALVAMARCDARSGCGVSLDCAQSSLHERGVRGAPVMPP
jgi:predicted DCC family thiol-disulfide oxidoreductase YuxK